MGSILSQIPSVAKLTTDCAYSYLQQLVTVQASRNRDLEQQLQTYRSGGTPIDPTSSTVNGTSGDGDDLSGLMLHDEVGGDDSFNLLSTTAMNGINGSAFHDGSSHHRKAFSGFELESVEEMDMEEDHLHNGHSSSSQHLRSRTNQDQDEDMDRPSTADTGTGAGETSPSAGSLDDEAHDDGEEEERGRKGRDGARPGLSLSGSLKSQGIVVGDVKIKEERDMETS